MTDNEDNEESIIIDVDESKPINAYLKTLIKAVIVVDEVLLKMAPFVLELCPTLNAYDTSIVMMTAYVEHCFDEPYKTYARLFREYYRKPIAHLEMGLILKIEMARELNTRLTIKRIITSVLTTIRRIYGTDLPKVPTAKKTELDGGGSVSTLGTTESATTEGSIATTAKKNVVKPASAADFFDTDAMEEGGDEERLPNTGGNHGKMRIEDDDDVEDAGGELALPYVPTSEDIDFIEEHRGAEPRVIKEAITVGT
jgi:hypothetical protein